IIGNPGYLEFAMIHEILHTLGFVQPCAPHFTAAGHVANSNTDLMYAGAEAWRPSTLDVGHDDYYMSKIPGCMDLADSPYLIAHGGLPTTAAPTATTVTPTSAKPKSKTHKKPPLCKRRQKSTVKHPCRRR